MSGGHFIDLLRFVAGTPIDRWTLTVIGGGVEGGIRDGKVTITLEFADGSMGYLASGCIPVALREAVRL
ncbi:MAG: hypothetical protein ACREVV_14670 [Steroidobacteraceae bacterium]